MNNVEVIIKLDGGEIISPEIRSLTVTKSFKEASKLSLKILDPDLDVNNGNPISVKVDGEPFFYGFVFAITDREDDINTLTCYDQIYYLAKNKDTYVVTNETATSILTLICNDFQLKYGSLEDTSFQIKKAIFDSKTLLDIVTEALYQTLDSTGKYYVLYDNYGELTLTDIDNLIVNDLIITDGTFGSYNIKTNITEDTYNQVKLYQEDEETGVREIYISKDSENINKWGLLQYYDKVENGENAIQKANTILATKNKQSRSVRVKSQFGDTRIIGGSKVLCQFQNLSNLMFVESVKHKFENNLYTMDLDLRGGTV